jgi:hypothetical protein
VAPSTRVRACTFLRVGDASRRFRDLLRTRSRTLRERAEEAGFFEHRPTKGRARESVLAELLKEFLPGRHGVSTGEVRAFDGSTSGEWDVLIYDALNTPKLHEQGPASVLPIETVQAAISVKSSVDGAANEEAVEAAAALRQMPRKTIPVTAMTVSTKRPQPAVYHFGFEGLALATAAERLTAAVDSGNETGALEGLCIHTSGLVLPYNDEQVLPTTFGLTTYKSVETGLEGSFGVFLGFLYVALSGAPLHAPD